LSTLLGAVLVPSRLGVSIKHDSLILFIFLFFFFEELDFLFSALEYPPTTFSNCEDDRTEILENAPIFRRSGLERIAAAAAPFSL